MIMALLLDLANIVGGFLLAVTLLGHLPRVGDGLRRLAAPVLTFGWVVGIVAMVAGGYYCIVHLTSGPHLFHFEVVGSRGRSRPAVGPADRAGHVQAERAGRRHWRRTAPRCAGNHRDHRGCAGSVHCGQLIREATGEGSPGCLPLTTTSLPTVRSLADGWRPQD